MKKTAIALLVMLMVLSLGATSAFAASKTHGANYVDANGDGICDNCLAGSVCAKDGAGRHADKNCARRSGVCRSAGHMDANGDGVCDNCPTGGVCPQDGTGAQCGKKCGKNR